jgi:hypothetical protein
MILYRNGFGLHDQEDLAVALGVKVGDDDKDAFKVEMPKMTAFNLDEGISTLDSVPRINAIFSKHTDSLCAEGILYSTMRSFKDIVTEAIGADRDLWIEYHSQEIHTNDHLHDGLLESFNSDTGNITLIDPSPRRRQRKIVSIALMERAISNKFGRETGVVLVRKTDGH